LGVSTRAQTPNITTYDPLQAAINVPADQTLQLTFDTNIQFNPSITRYYIEIYEIGNLIPVYESQIRAGSADNGASIAGNVLTIDPPTTFNGSTEHYVLIDPDGILADPSGDPFPGIISTTQWTFTTEALTDPPAVLSYDPIQNEVDVPVNKTFILTFVDDIKFNPSSTRYYIEIFEDGNPISVYESVVRFGAASNGTSILNNVLTIDPPNSLNGNTIHYITINPDAILSDPGNVPFSGILDPNQWRFTTVNLNPPSILTYNPTQGEIDVPVDKTLTLTFQENIKFNPSSTRYYIEIFEDGNPTSIYTSQVRNGIADNGASILNNVLTIDPPTDFIDNTIHYVTIEANAILSDPGDLPFTGISDPNQWRFTTVDIIPPVITDYTPSQGVVDVPIDQIINLTFSQNIKFNPSATRYYIDIYELGNPTPIYESQIRNGIADNGASILNNVLTIDAPINFSNSTTHYVIIDADGILSNPGDIPFAGILDPATYEFTTILPAPTTTFNPLSGSTGVSILSNVTINYDLPIRNIDASEITELNLSNLITFETGGTPIPYTATINLEKTSITIDPDSDLPMDSQIDVSILPVENMVGVEQSTSQLCSFSTDLFNVWNGSVSTDFADNNNWNSPYVNGFSIHIPYPCTFYPAITSNQRRANICTVDAGASLTINAGGRLTVDDYFELKSSNSETIGNANFINNGTLSISQGAETRVLQEISTEPYDYYFSSPVASASISSIGCNGQVWERMPGYWSELATTDPFTPGQGYVGWSTAGTTWTFSGDINNNASYQMNAVRTASPNNYGWNLAGNPYPCSIDFKYIYDNGFTTNLNSSFYIRIIGTNQQGAYNAATDLATNLNSPNPAHIPSLHAFYVQVDIAQTNGSITVPKEARVGTNFTYLKSGSTLTPHLKLEGINGTKSDELAIAFLADASDNYDLYDTEKQFASDSYNFLQLYTINDMKNLTIDTYKTYAGGKSIDLGYQASQYGEYHIKLKSMVNFSDQLDVVLEDKSLGTLTALQPGSELSFTSDKGRYEDRFTLHLSEAISTQENYNTIDLPIKIYSQEKSIYILLPEVADPIFKILNTNGQIIESGKLSSNLLNIINTNYSSGIFLIQIISKEGNYTEKLIIK